MPSWDVCLLTASYRREGDEVVLQLYGKTREGQAITIRALGFKPYFEIAEPPPEVLERLHGDPIILAVDPCQLFHRGRIREAYKVTLKFPWLVPEYRSWIRERCDVLAADIPFHLRFVYDRDIGVCTRVTGREVAAGDYTTPLVVEAERFEDILPFRPVLKLLSFDIETSLKERRIYAICAVIRENGKLRSHQFWGEERKMLEDFTSLIRKEDPDILTGYNIDGFDIPQILECAKVLKVPTLNWGRAPGALEQYNNRFWYTEGRIIADTWWSVKRQLRPKQETLNAVARLVLGEEKLDVDPARIDEEWAADRTRVLDYCTKDAELALRLLEKVAILEKYLDIAAVARLPLDDALNGTTSQLIDALLIRAADRSAVTAGGSERVGVPLTNRAEEYEPIEGGYVHTLEPGLYHWVAVLDFVGMYPSLIIKNNICFTTLNDSGTIVSPTGSRFLAKEMREGLLPRVLVRLRRDRDEFKRRMREGASEEERRYYQGLQEAIKILMNAVYGVFASTFYRFTDQRIGASITAFGREAIKQVIEALEREGLKVIYSDTDSVFYQSPLTEPEGAVAFGKQLAERFSKEGVTLEFERLMEPFFTHGAKKRYVGRSVWPREELVIRGYEIRRTDAFDLQSDVLTRVFERILDGKREEAVEEARRAVAEVAEGKAPIEKLVISRSVRPFGAYKEPDSMANVQAAKKLMKLGYEFQPGMKVSWIVTDSRKSPQEVEPYVRGRPFTATPDWRYYADRVAMTIARVTETFGWDQRSLASGQQQTTLLGEDFGTRRKGKAEPKKAAGKKTLEDYW